MTKEMFIESKESKKKTNTNRILFAFFYFCSVHFNFPNTKIIKIINS